MTNNFPLENFMKPRLVGIAGYVESGKDTAAEVLRQHLGWQIIECSGELKKSLLAMNPIVCIEVNQGSLSPMFFLDYFHKICKSDWRLAKKNPEVRRLLQHLGTQAGRDIHGEDCWIRKIMGKVDFFVEDAFAITGVRFQNEIDAIKKRNGLMLWMDREQCKPMKSHAADDTEWIKEQCTLVPNNGTLDDLKEQILTLIPE